MVRKVVDIVPKKKEKITFPKKEKREKKIKIRFPKISLPLIFIFLLFIGAIIISAGFSKVRIEIWPKVEQKSFEEKIIIDTSLESLDFQKKKIPGKIFEIEKEIQESFPATGKVLKKAEGKIRLYNSYTTEDETWVAGTRFMSSEGKLFLAKERFLVPGAKMKEGKLEPSFVDVEVIAAEGGSDYNIGPSKFSIVAFKGTERYFKYWGESTEPMKGGGEAPIVKKEDLETALNSLIEKIEKEKGKEILKKEIPEGKIFPENAISVEILDQNFSAKEGDEVSNFTLKVKAKIKTILLDKRDLQKFLEKEFYSNFGKGKKILKETEKIEISSSVANFESGKFLIFLKDSVKVLPEIEPALIKKEIAGEKVREAKSKLEGLKDVEKVKVSIFPLWISKVPENLERIEVFVFETLD
jgi:hypothetical protein